MNHLARISIRSFESGQKLPGISRFQKNAMSREQVNPSGFGLIICSPVPWLIVRSIGCSEIQFENGLQPEGMLYLR